jgi:dynein heavy chain
VKILQGDDLIDGQQYRFLLSGISTSHVNAPLPSSNGWLQQNIWSDLMDLAGLERFKKIPEAFDRYMADWQAIFDSSEPHKAEFPPPLNKITSLERLCLLRCLRRDKMELGMQDFIIESLGERFIQPPPFDLKACFNDSIITTPLIFVLSSGSDPNKELDLLADDLNMSDRLKRIALGQGQGKKASSLIEKGLVAGDW